MGASGASRFRFCTASSPVSIAHPKTTARALNLSEPTGASFLRYHRTGSIYTIIVPGLTIGSAVESCSQH